MITKIILLRVKAVFIILYSRRTELLIKQESSYGTIISYNQRSKKMVKVTIPELKREREKDIRTEMI